MRRKLLGLMLFSCVLFSGNYAYAQAVTDAQARLMTPDAFKDILLHQLGNILIPRHVSVQEPMFQPVFETMPQATSKRGICMRDRIEFETESLRDKKYDYWEAPQKVVGVRATRLFRFLTLPTEKSDNVVMTETEIGALETDCAAAVNAQFFTADNYVIAEQGVLLLSAIHLDVASGKLPRAYSCEDVGTEACVSMINSLTLDNLFQVRLCDEGRAAYLTCIEVYSSDVRMIVRSSGYMRTPETVSVSKIEPVE